MALTKNAVGREPSAEERRLERKDRRHETRRRIIMDSAEALLVGRGLGHFTVGAVAAAAGVSKSAVYYYFESKEDLLVGLAVRALQCEADVLRRAVDGAEGGLEALQAVVRAYVDHYGKDPETFKVLYVWPQVLGIEQRVRDSDACVKRRAVIAAIEGGLSRESAVPRAMPEERAASLVCVALAMARGVVAGATCPISDETSRSVQELGEEICRVIERASAP